jgi:hypothetical protein
LSHAFPVQNGLKQGDALPLLHINFALEYVIRKVPENQIGLKFNGTYHFLAILMMLLAEHSGRAI